MMVGGFLCVLCVSATSALTVSPVLYRTQRSQGRREHREENKTAEVNHHLRRLLDSLTVTCYLVTAVSVVVAGLERLSEVSLVQPSITHA